MEQVILLYYPNMNQLRFSAGMILLIGLSGCSEPRRDSERHVPTKSPLAPAAFAPSRPAPAKAPEPYDVLVDAKGFTVPYQSFKEFEFEIKNSYGVVICENYCRKPSQGDPGSIPHVVLNLYQQEVGRKDWKNIGSSGLTNERSGPNITSIRTPGQGSFRVRLDRGADPVVIRVLDVRIPGREREVSPYSWGANETNRFFAQVDQEMAQRERQAAVNSDTESGRMGKGSSQQYKDPKEMFRWVCRICGETGTTWHTGMKCPYCGYPVPPPRGVNPYGGSSTLVGD